LTEAEHIGSATLDLGQIPNLKSYQFRLHWNDLTTESAENAEEEKREMNNSDEGRI